MLKFFIPSVTFFALIVSTLCAGEIRFYGETDKDPLAYKPGEEMVFSVQLLDEGKPVEGVTLKWFRRGDDGLREEGSVVSAAEPLVIRTKIEVPGFVHVNVQALDKEGKTLKDGERNIVPFDGGAGVRLDEIQGYPEPEDFDEFWAKQKARLAEVPMRVEMVPVESGAEGVLCFDVKVDCVGRPVSGYYCKPKGAAPKSLPAHVTFHGYGIRSSNKPTWAREAIVFDVNAHGILNGQPQEYYEALQKGELAGYGFNKEENQNPETAYFNGMFLRLMRALEFIKAQPEWNGEVLIVSGGSQGGLQCLSAAGLDADVTECRAYVPWCLDLGGRNLKRLGGWFPEWTDALGYYDAANHAKRIKAKTTIVAGLGDYVCPPSGQIVLYNNLKCEKELTFHQGKTHGYTMPNGTKSVLKSAAQ
ncbi:MAG: acetylxylan esterase [Planctomycetia bacterium]|nr:acetylxylan esterase [Planctomycetia bacterium]